MKNIALILALVLVWQAEATVYYVRTDGLDSHTGLANTSGAAWLTVQKAANTVVAGDTVNIAAGTYNEYVDETTSGSAGLPIIYHANQDAIIRAFRVNNAAYLVLDGLVFVKPQNTWLSHIRVEPQGNNLIVTNCFFHDTALVIRTNWFFDSSDSSISSSGVDFAAAGFITNGVIYCGGSAFSTYLYTNHDRAFTITGISGSKIIVTPAVYVETNTSAWAPIFSGATPLGEDGILMVPSGGISASNALIINNTFSNIYGSPFSMGGQGHVITGNRTYNTYSRASIHPYGWNLTVTNNFWLNSTNWIYYGAWESVPHVGGADYWDYVQGHIHNATPGSNIVFRANWWENVHQPFCDIDETANRSSTNWLFESNVVIGFHRSGGIGINGTIFKNNTFYRDSVDTGQAVITQMGNDSGHPATNMQNYFNVYIDVGDHSTTNAEGFYANTYVTNSFFGSNFVCGPETTWWQALSSFTETNGINGGNPMLVNPQNPRGPDGLPFTADDGLRPLPQSPIAIKGWGALAPASIVLDAPKANFTVRPTDRNWTDAVGTNFNTAWTLLKPFERTDIPRPYNTPESVGKVPCQVTIDASTSISGNFSTTNNYGIKYYWFDYGDGAIVQSWTATNSHTYLWPATNTITVTVENWSGNRATNSLIYRVLAQTSTNAIWHVATNGNDTTGNGSITTPYATLAKAITVVGPGNYIAMHQGDYASYTDVNRDVAVETNRIAICGFGAEIGGMQVRYPNWTVEGLAMDGIPSTTSAGVYVYQEADNILIQNCRFHDFTNNGGTLVGPIYVTASGANEPTNGCLNGKVISCTFTNNKEIQISIGNGTNWLVSSFIVLDSKGEGDFIRPYGQGHIFQDGYCYGLDNGTSGGHPDFVQLAQPFQATNGVWLQDMLIQRVWMDGDTNSDSDAEIGSFESLNFGSSHYTNFVIRNCIFRNVRGQLNDSNDGLKLYNNLFYRSPRDSAAITTGGGTQGSSYGTEFYNNIFFECGISFGTNTGVGWYYDALSGAQASNTTVFANYNFVCGTNYASRPANPPDSTGRWGANSREVNGINGGNPLFIDAIRGDFRLRTNSILKSTGITISGFSTDFLGQERPASWSIGPFESGEDIGRVKITTTTLTVGTLRLGQ